jgi:hypothetical protein
MLPLLDSWNSPFSWVACLRILPIFARGAAGCNGESCRRAVVLL